MLGIDVIDGSLLAALFIATLGGVLSFLSPCVLPIVPPYLAYMAGTSVPDAQSKRRMDPKVVMAAIFFVMGLSTVFIFLGFAASFIGQAFLQYQRQMAIGSGLIILIFGLHFLHVFRIPILDREARLEAGDRSGTAVGAYVMGLAFAFGWTPCIGPVLGAILSLAAQEDTVSRGVLMMAFYALGLGIPFLIAAMFLSRAMGTMNKIKPHMPKIEKAMGGLLVFVGLMLVFGFFTQFSYWLLETFPALGLVG